MRRGLQVETASVSVVADATVKNQNHFVVHSCSFLTVNATDNTKRIVVVEQIVIVNNMELIYLILS